MKKENMVLALLLSLLIIVPLQSMEQQQPCQKWEILPAAHDVEITWLTKQHERLIERPIVIHHTPSNKEFNLEQICIDLMMLNVLERYSRDHRYHLKISAVEPKITNLHELEKERDVRIIIQKAKEQPVDLFLKNHAVRKQIDLQRLTLKDHELTALDQSIGQLTSLTELNLENNQLTTLPDSIGNLTKLRSLHLKGNHLQSFPDTIMKLTALKTLTLKKEQARMLPSTKLIALVSKTKE